MYSQLSFLLYLVNKLVFISLCKLYLQKRYRWADEQGPVISTLFWQKCAARTKDNLAKDRGKALHNAGVDHPGRAMEHMHEYSPWWCSAEIWAEMCNQWRDESWVKKRKIASSNRVGGGGKAKGTYKGGSISQLQHLTVKVCMNSCNMFTIMNSRISHVYYFVIFVICLV